MIIRILLMIIGIAGIVVFYLPLGKKGIVNVGNVVGMIFSVLMLLFGTFSWLFSRSFKIVVLVIVLLILVLFIIVNMKMSNAKHNVASNQTVVIVPGCTSKYYVSEALTSRIKEAARYLDKNKDAICIACGGIKSDFYESEADYIAVELSKYGIQKSRIIVENKSQDTFENMKFARKIISEKNLSKEVAISTNEYHQYRAALSAERCGLKPSAINVSTDKMVYPTFFVREMIAIVYYWIRKK